MKTLCLIICVVLAIPAVARSQEPYRHGDWALSFSVSGLHLLGLPSVHRFDRGIGGKWWRWDDTALVGTVNIVYDDFAEDRGSDVLDRRREARTGIGIGFERHFGSLQFSPYFGSLLGYGYRNSKEDYTEPSLSASRTAVEHVVSLGGTAGVEFWLTSRFSLAGEYRLDVRYHNTWHEITYPSGNKFSHTQTTWRFGVGTSLLLLSVYF